MAAELELGTRVSERRFSPSSVEIFLACPRQFYLYYIRKIRPEGRGVAQHFGTSIHAGVAEFYAAREETENFEEVKIRAVQAFAEEWATLGQQGDEKRNLHSGIELMEAYCKIYKEDSSHFKKELIECAQWIPMPNDTLLGGRLDRIEAEQSVTVWDTKTSARNFTDWTLKQYEMSFQLSSYFYIAQEILGDCDSVGIDGVKVPWQKKETFVRRTYIRTDIMLDEWLNTYLRATDIILEGFSLSDEEEVHHFFQNQGSCADYGGCKYIPICQYGLDHPAVRNEYTFKEREKKAND